MLVGVISDVHANRVALRAVLEDMPEVDRLVCAGDVVGYNPWPADCVDALRDRDVPTVAGNHDRAVVTGTGFGGNGMAQAGVEHAREVLDGDRLAWLEGLPAERRVLDGRVKLVHGHPDDPDRYTLPEQFAPGMLDAERVLVLGHTHLQAHRTFDAGVVVNPGSVGQPRDGDPRAAYAVLDLPADDAGTPTVEERRVEYDVDRVESRVREVGLPERTGTRLRTGQ